MSNWMKSVARARPLNLLTAMLLLSGGSAALALETRIDRVTVYRSGAVVERIATLTLAAGRNELAIEGLPAELDVARVELLTGRPDVRLAEVRRSSDQRADAVSPEVQALEAALQSLAGEEQALADAVSVAELKLKFLDGLAQGYAKDAWYGVAGGSDDTGAWGQALATLDSGASAALAQIRSTAVEQQRQKARRSQLERELKQARGKERASTTIALTATSASAQTIELRLRYPQPAARWRSTYEARMDSASGELELLQQAAVTQTTPEDWTDVELVLSTGNPSRRIAPPTLNPKFVDLYDPEQLRMMKRRRPAAAMNGVQGFAAAAPSADMAMEAAPIEEVVIAAEVTSYGVTYAVPGRVTIANDSDDAQRFDLERLSFEAELVTRIVPRQADAGFLVANFTYAQAAPLAASRLRAYLDGDYVGEATLPAARQGAELELPLGQNRRIEVVVEDQGGLDGESGIINKRREEAVDFLYRIVNRGSTPAAIEVLDQLPVARNEEIAVTVPRSATKPTARDIDDRPGVLKWERSLDAGGEWEIRHQYKISYPADERLTGH
ncbi:MAG: mucoidy inhibitor MuiA family protein [Pseudomonadota bacterium]